MKKKVNRKLQFPSIYRRITEEDKSFLIMFGAVLIMFFAVLLLSFDLTRNIATRNKKIAEKNQALSNKDFWQKVVDKYPDYRDGFFLLANSEYQLGDFKNSFINIEKSLTIDPNFKEALDLKKKLK